MIRGALITLCFLPITLLAQHEMSQGPFSSWSLCQEGGRPLQTQFPRESVGLFRERNANNSQGEAAARYLAGQSLQSCSFSNNRFRSLDRAQTLVTTDLMTRVQQLTEATQQRSIEKIRELQNCTAASKYNTSECQRVRDQDVPQLNQRLSEMRIARAISMISADGGCGNGVFQSLNSERQARSIFQCLAKENVSHDIPFSSRITGGGERARQIDSLSAAEKQQVIQFFMRAAPELRNNPRGLQAIRSQAKQDYERLLADYPILNYVNTPHFSLTHESVQSGLSRLEQNAQRELQNIRSPRFMSEGIFSEAAVAAALNEIPQHRRGNYCEMANRLRSELGRRDNARTFLLVGLGFATMGVGGAVGAGTAVGRVAGLVGGTGTEALGMALSMQDYNNAIQACQSSATERSGTCNLERLATARDNLPTPTQGALFLAGGAVDFLGALRRAGRVGEAAVEGATGAAPIARAADDVSLSPAERVAATAEARPTSTTPNAAPASSTPSSPSGAAVPVGTTAAAPTPATGAAALPRAPDNFDLGVIADRSFSDFTVRAPVADRTVLTGERTGVSYLQLETGTIGEQRVFLKTTSENLGTLRPTELPEAWREAMWTQAMSDLGVGPRFHGVTTTPVGGIPRPTIVTDFIEGQHLQMNKIDQYAGLNNDSVQQQILEIGRRLDAQGISAIDLQFRVTPTGRVYVIDAEGFQLHRPGGVRSSDLAQEYVDALRQGRAPSSVAR